MSNQKSEELIAEIHYDITLDEEDKAFRIFQRLYVFKKNLFRSVLFAIVAAVFIAQIIMDKGDAVSWGLAAVCIAFIAVIWITPIRIRKTLLTALEALKDDRYILRLYDNGFEIETIIPQSDAEIVRDIDKADREEQNVQSEQNEESDDEALERIKPPVSKYEFSKDGLRLVENDEMYLIFVSRETFHILPKRVLSESEKSIVDEKFCEKFKEKTAL